MIFDIIHWLKFFSNSKFFEWMNVLWKSFLNSKAFDETAKFHQKFSLDKKDFQSLCDHNIQLAKTLIKPFNSLFGTIKEPNLLFED